MTREIYCNKCKAIFDLDTSEYCPFCGEYHSLKKRNEELSRSLRWY